MIGHRHTITGDDKAGRESNPTNYKIRQEVTPSPPSMDGSQTTFKPKRTSGTGRGSGDEGQAAQRTPPGVGPVGRQEPGSGAGA